MNLLLKNMTHLRREEVLMLGAVIFASLVGLLGTAVFLIWTNSFNDIAADGIRPFLVSLAATLIYSLVMGGMVFLLHPKKGLLKNVVAKNR
jgi:hypothetical protein